MLLPRIFLREIHYKTNSMGVWVQHFNSISVCITLVRSFFFLLLLRLWLLLYKLKGNVQYKQRQETWSSQDLRATSLTGDVLASASPTPWSGCCCMVNISFLFILIWFNMCRRYLVLGAWLQRANEYRWWSWGFNYPGAIPVNAAAPQTSRHEQRHPSVLSRGVLRARGVASEGFRAGTAGGAFASMSTCIHCPHPSGMPVWVLEGMPARGHRYSEQESHISDLAMNHVIIPIHPLIFRIQHSRFGWNLLSS